MTLLYEDIAILLVLKVNVSGRDRPIINQTNIQCLFPIIGINVFIVQLLTKVSSSVVNSNS